MEDAENWEFVNLDDERIGIKTSTLEEKSTACEMLCVYAKEMRGGFAPYLQEVGVPYRFENSGSRLQVSEIAQRHLKFYFDDGNLNMQNLSVLIVKRCAVCCSNGGSVSDHLCTRVTCIRPGRGQLPVADVHNPPHFVD